MSNEEKFLEHWQPRLVGMALRGVVLDRDERTKGPYSAGKFALDLPDKIAELLRQMFRHAKQLEAKPLTEEKKP